jgi:ADP-ribose diphosphatase
MIRHSGASAVVPLLELPDGQTKVILIRQYRYAAESYVYEVPAGRLDPGESPEACAYRELKEETGYTAATMTPLTTIFTTPGFTDERIHLFLATGLSAGQSKLESDEVLDLHPVSLGDAVDMIRTGAICDGKTISALLFVAQFTELK